MAFLLCWSVLFYDTAVNSFGYEDSVLRAVIAPAVQCLWMSLASWWIPATQLSDPNILATPFPAVSSIYRALQVMQRTINPCTMYLLVFTRTMLTCVCCRPPRLKSAFSEHSPSALQCGMVGGEQHLRHAQSCFFGQPLQRRSWCLLAHTQTTLARYGAWGACRCSAVRSHPRTRRMQPAYARLVELMVPSAVLGFMYLRCVCWV